MSRSLALGLAFAVLSIPAVAGAQPGQPPPPPPPGSSPGYGYGAYGMVVPGVHEHDGFYLNLGFGLGYNKMSADFEGTDRTIKGGGGTFTLKLGGNVARNLIIFGNLFANVAVEPTLEEGGDEVDLEDVNAGVRGLGVGLAYYLDNNLFFSGTLAAAQLAAQYDNGTSEDDDETDFGPTFVGEIGKEWWVSDNWGLGLAGQVIVGSMKEKDNSDITWTTVAAGLNFSATYD
jgi:hypothetical protein